MSYFGDFNHSATQWVKPTVLIYVYTYTKTHYDMLLSLIRLSLQSLCTWTVTGRSTIGTEMWNKVNFKFEDGLKIIRIINWQCPRKTKQDIATMYNCRQRWVYGYA